MKVILPSKKDQEVKMVSYSSIWFILCLAPTVLPAYLNNMNLEQRKLSHVHMIIQKKR